MFTSFTHRPVTLKSKVLWGIIALMSVLSFALVACGGSSNPSTATVYIDEHEGDLNGKDTPALDKFWWSNSATDTNFVTSYSMSVAPGATITVTNKGDDGQKITITGPSNYSNTTMVAGDASATIQMPSTTGDYTFISDPTTSPVRPGARGGTITVG
jgi:hypothetical protein